MSNSSPSRKNPAALVLLLVLFIVLAVVVFSRRDDIFAVLQPTDQPEMGRKELPEPKGDPAAEQEAAAKLRERKVDGKAAFLIISEPPDKKVTCVNFLGRPVDDDALDQVAKLYRLSALNADKCQITDAQLKRLAGLTHLASLVLSDTPVGDEGLANIAPMKGIEALHLSGTQITNRGLGHLVALDNLKILNLSNTKVDDEGLKSLLPIKGLKWLLLADNEITDAGLETLAAMSNLGRLTINGTKVTPEGIEMLKQAIPKLSVDYAPPQEKTEPTAEPQE